MANDLARWQFGTTTVYHFFFVLKRLFTMRYAKSIEVHQQVDGDGGDGKTSLPGDVQHGIPGLGNTDTGLCQQVGTIARHGSSGVDGQRPLMAIIFVAMMGIANGMLGLVLKIAGGKIVVEREDGLRRSGPDHRSGTRSRG